jgi:hypothetical protein
MIVCKECGHDNGLGLVFCQKCRAKLDTDNLSIGRLASLQHKQRWVARANWHHVKRAAIALLVLAIVLALWPYSQPLGSSGQPATAQPMTSFLTAAGHLNTGVTLGREFSEAEVNSYLDFKITPELRNTTFVRARLQKYLIRLRIVRKLVSIPIGVWKKEFSLSYDIAVVPVGSTFRVRSISIGHLPCPGPLRRMVLAAAVQPLKERREATLMPYLVEIKSDEGKLELTFKK